MGRKVFLVGDGAVGSTFANDLLQNVQVDELVICDVAKDRAFGDTLDIEDITPFTGNTKVRTGEYSEAGDADVCVITAGVPRKPGETRLDLIAKNVKILQSIIKPVVDSGFKGVFVVSANPVDILTTLTQKLSGFPKSRVIGTGTSLDSMRLRVEISKRLNVPVTDVYAMVLGEHGDTSFENFQEAMIGDKPLRSFEELTDEVLEEIETEIRKKGGKIIANKGATYYGVAMMLTQIVKSILENKAICLPVSAPIDGEYGIKHNLYLGTPAVIDGRGIVEVIQTPLTDQEQAKMQFSADKMAEALASIEL